MLPLPPSWATTIWSSRLLHSRRDSKFLSSKTLFVLQPALAGISPARRLNFRSCASMDSQTVKNTGCFTSSFDRNICIAETYCREGKMRRRRCLLVFMYPRKLIVIYFRSRSFYSCTYARIYIGPLRFSIETVLL